MSSPFSIFPVELLKLDLTETELRVLVALYSFRGKNTDTVWPSLRTLGDRAGIKDHTRVSKITTRLAQKECLEKVKSGFKGNNRYKLIIPNLDESQLANLDESSHSESTNLDDSSNIDESTKSNLDESYPTKLDESSKLNKHTNNKPIEHTNRARNFQRSGKFPMTQDWLPDPQFWEANKFKSGSPDYSPEQLHEFQTYWCGETTVQTENQWQLKLISSLKRQAQKQTPVDKKRLFDEVVSGPRRSGWAEGCEL